MGRTSSPRGASRAHVTSLIRHVRALKVYVFSFRRRVPPSNQPLWKVGLMVKSVMSLFVKLSPHGLTTTNGGSGNLQKPPQNAPWITQPLTHSANSNPGRLLCSHLKVGFIGFKEFGSVCGGPLPQLPALIPIFNTICIPSNEPQLCTQSPQIYIYSGYLIYVRFSS